MPRLITNIALETMRDAGITLRDFTRRTRYGKPVVCVSNVSDNALYTVIAKVGRLNLAEKRRAVSQVDTPCSWDILPDGFREEPVAPGLKLDGDTARAVITEIYNQLQP